MATRSPFWTPRPRNTAANATTFCNSSAYVQLTDSPGSLSQMMAALSLLAVFRWRSKQLSLALSSAPTNHLECGSSHSHSADHGLRNTKSEVSRSQKLAGDSMLSLYSSSYLAPAGMRDVAENSGLGWKVRLSAE